MTAAPTPIADATIPTPVDTAFAALRAGYAQAGGLTYSQRMASLTRLADASRRREPDIAATISADFGHRSTHETAMTEIFPLVSAVRYIQKHLKSWMKPERRHIDWLFRPARGEVRYQALGVVGVIGPWNYPYHLAMVPLAYALAAGNRVLLKPSEMTPRTADVIGEIVTDCFPSDVVQVVTGGVDVGVAVSGLPLDHLFFTGSTAVGRHIMRAASEHLTPVTLELGGKSPAVIHESYDMRRALSPILGGKLWNAGQTCVAPDYVLCPSHMVEALVHEAEALTAELYPTLAHNPDYSSVAADKHHKRLTGLLDDARARGARVVPINPDDAKLPDASRKMPLTLVLDVDDDMAVMNEEIFGPILPVVPYDTLDDAISYINARPRPLALYYFDTNRARADRVLEETVSGGACINETMLHLGMDDLPFGGVGPSGMGAYHGREGFLTFSHQKSVLRQTPISARFLLAPPYGKRLDFLLDRLIGRKKP